MNAQISTLSRLSLILCCFSLITAMGCNGNSSGSKIPDSIEGYEKTTSGLFIKDIEVGQGIEVQEGDMVGINETLTYRDGTVLFSTDKNGQPVKFTVGAGQAIDGIDEGVRGMKIGGIRSLVIPPSLSKRTEYPDNIHPDSILVNTVSLVLLQRP
jgi:FKBP-type peptidyl-prolyl cis-trans isomerase